MRQVIGCFVWMILVAVGSAGLVALQQCDSVQRARYERYERMERDNQGWEAQKRREQLERETREFWDREMGGRP